MSTAQASSGSREPYPVDRAFYSNRFERHYVETANGNVLVDSQGYPLDVRESPQSGGKHGLRGDRDETSSNRSSGDSGGNSHTSRGSGKDLPSDSSSGSSSSSRASELSQHLEQQRQ